jgi:hypothetical protein
MIQEEWEESLRQLEMVLSIVVVPFFGKWYGRRFSYWSGSLCIVQSSITILTNHSFRSVFAVRVDKGFVRFEMMRGPRRKIQGECEVY